MWRTAAELAGLPGLPTSERRTRDWLVRIGVPSRQRAGAGGGREFDVEHLPDEARRALMTQQVAQATLPGLLEQPPVETFNPPAIKEQLPAAARTQRTPSKAEAACADGRLQLVQHLIGSAMIVGITRAAQALSDQLATGECDPRIMAAAEAANRRPREIAEGVSISQRTLFMWHKAHAESGWWGLLPKPATKRTVAQLPSDVAAVLKTYASTQGLSRNLTHCAQQVTKSLGRPYDDWRRLYDQARRALPKLDRTQLIKARHTGSDCAAKLPFKRRSTENLVPLDVGVIDGHSFKAKVRHPDHGQPFTPEVTLVLDAACKRITGWSASLSESTMAVGAAVCHSATVSGVHAVMYSDNGKGETAKQLDCPLDGLYARLGTQHPTGRPGNPQGRGIIERSWRTHMIRAARQFKTFNGADVDGPTLRQVELGLQREQRAVDRARKTGEVVKLTRDVPTWQEFLDAVQRAVDDYNALHRHRSLPKHQGGEKAGLHMTPDEAWAHMLQPELVVRPSAEEIRLLFQPSKISVARRGEVQFLNLHYFSEALMQVDGDRVSVRYDIHDPRVVWVWTLAGEFVCEAVLDANRTDFFPGSVVQQARERRVAGMVRRAQQRIDTAMRELNPALPAGVSVPMLPTAAMVPTVELPIAERLDLVEIPAAAPAIAAAPAARRLFDSPSERYEWLMTHRADWTEADATWLARYAQSDDYAALSTYFADRGLAWDAAQSGFKTAG
ncbi:MAG: integrase [Roseateles sp.]|nr:MAG: integrase [Roseateles sp.]